jgi:hypothetical protein
LVTGGAVLVPFGLACVALPLRRYVPGADVAVVLVGAIALAGTVGVRATPALTALSGAVAFDLLWVSPYGSLQMRGPADRLTGLVVLVVGGGLAERGRRRRRRPPRTVRIQLPGAIRSTHLSTIRRVAGDIAEGDTAGLVVLDIARSLVDVFRLRDCRFEVAPLPLSERPVLLANGELALDGVRWSPIGIGVSDKGFDLPVIARGHLAGRFVCQPRTRISVSREQLAVALTLADQAASALLLADVA